MKNDNTIDNTILTAFKRIVFDLFLNNGAGAFLLAPIVSYVLNDSLPFVMKLLTRLISKPLSTVSLVLCVLSGALQ